MQTALPIYVLDSFALLALLQGGAGGDRVREILEAARQVQCEAHISLINLGELAYIVERRSGAKRTQEVVSYLRNTALQWAEVDERRIWSASHLKATYPISYTDAFAAALALELDAVLVTGDPEFHELEQVIQIEWLASNDAP